MKKIVAAGMIGVGLCLLLIFLYRSGFILLNHPDVTLYPVRGIDVSEFQGEIDWKVLSEKNDFKFTFIKATEGSGYQDLRFAENWRESKENGFIRGAYHFFSFESTGEKQADHFISVVPKESGMLPPAVDIELYGKYKYQPLPKEEVILELDSMLAKLEDYYGMKPILYATGDSYSRYLSSDKTAHPLWIRNVFSQPGTPWTFWQYSDKGSIEGFEGPEKFIDLNVFYGNEDEWNRWLDDTLKHSSLNDTEHFVS